MTMADELLKLQTLREQGALTEEEFAQAKARILNESTIKENTNGSAKAEAPAPQPSILHRLHRSASDQWIGGVCGGLAEVTQMPSWSWRIFFVLSAFLHGLGVLIYLFMWVFVPLQRSAPFVKQTSA